MSLQVTEPGMLRDPRIHPGTTAEAPGPFPSAGADESRKDERRKAELGVLRERGGQSQERVCQVTKPQRSPEIKGDPNSCN